MVQVTVIGAGAWGTALALQLAKRGHAVQLWGRDRALMDDIAATRRNVYLPDFDLPPEIRIQNDFISAVAAEFVLLAVPTVAVREIGARLAPEIGVRHRGLAWACKGIEAASGCLVHEAMQQTIGDKLPVAAIGGPSFAGETAAGMPTAITVASADAATAAAFAELLHGDNLRVYTTDDVIGVEVGGALKNVVAIAAGISDGLGFGENARAALITRGLNEILRLAPAIGGRNETIMGLAGLGDIVLSCTSGQSRNHRFGRLLAEGLDVNTALSKVGGVVEGFPTTDVALDIARRHGVEMPICEQIQLILRKKTTARQAVQDLLQRPAGTEANPS